MRLETITPTAGQYTRVMCCCCGVWTSLEACKADLDGPAFFAYWCAACEPQARDDHPAYAKAPTRFNAPMLQVDPT